MEGGAEKTKNSDVGKSDVAFHSENIAGTKAKEKREVFVHVVEQKKTIKQTAEEFQKKFEEARKRNQEAAEKAKGKIKKRLSKRAITAIIVAIIVLPIAGFIAYYLIKNPQLTDPSLAAYLEMQENYDAGFETYQRLVTNASSPKEESELLVKRGYASFNVCGKSCLSKVIDDANSAELIYPSADTALLYYHIEKTRGHLEVANSWLATSNTRGAPSSWWTILDSWNNKNGAKDAS